MGTRTAENLTRNDVLFNGRGIVSLTDAINYYQTNNILFIHRILSIRVSQLLLPEIREKYQHEGETEKTFSTTR